MPAPSSPRPQGAAPLAPVATGLAAGCALGLAAPAFAASLVAAFLLAGCLPGRLRIACWSLALGLLLGGHAAGSQPMRRRPLPLPACYELEGVVRSLSARGRDVVSVVLDVEWVGTAPERWRVALTTRLVAWRPGDGGLDGVVPGARVSCVAHVDPPEPRGDGRRASQPWLRGRLTDTRALRVLRPPSGADSLLARMRVRAGDVLDNRLGERDAGLARALLLGDRSGLDAADRTTFRSAGQAHLLAVSGLHVGLLLGALVWTLRRLGAPVRGAWILGLVVAALYVPFTGAPPSAVRAGVGAAIYFTGRLLDRPPRGMAVLALVAVAILVARPASIGEVSFQLSFAAVLAILSLSARIRRRLVAPRPWIPGVSAPPRAPIRTALAVSLAAWLGTAPLVALHIGRLAPAAALVALPALPLTALALACGFGLLALESVPLLATGLAGGFGLAAGWLRDLLGGAASAGLGTREVGAPPAAWWALHAGAFAAAATLRGRAATCALIALLLLASLLFVLPGAEKERTRADGSREYHARVATMPVAFAPHVLAEPGALLLLGGGLLVFGVLSVRPLAWLTPGGALAAWILGMGCAWRFGWAGLAAAFAPFIVATLLGKLPGPGRSGARNLRQVLSNGLPAIVGCGLSLLGWPHVGALWFLGALACLGADTCATEIGVRFGGTPFRLAGRGPIRSGDSGGVTLLGLLAALGGGVLAPAAFWLGHGGGWVPVAAAAVAGFAGALIDSLLGGSLQYRGAHPADGRLVEARRVDGVQTERRSGLSWLDNDAVNLVSGLAAGALAVSLGGLV